MGVGQGLLRIFRNGFVEVIVFAVGDIVLRAQPDSLDVVDELPLPDLLGNGLELGCGVLAFSVERVSLFFSSDLDLFVARLFMSFDFARIGSLGLVNWDLLLHLSGHVQTDRVVNELGVLLDQVLDLVLFNEL